MTDPNTIDPQQMRETVQQAIQMAILAERGNQIRHAIVRNGWANPADDTYAALHETIRAEYDRQVDELTWPDGQPTLTGPTTPAAVDPQQERGGDDAFARVKSFADAWHASNTAYNRRSGYLTIDPLTPGAIGRELTESDLLAVVAELEQLRAEVADFPELLADAQEVGLHKLEQAFGDGWDRCREHMADEGRLKKRIYATEYSNRLPWPSATPQQPEPSGGAR